MNHPYVVPGWRFDFGAQRFDGAVGVITDGEPCHVGLFAYEPSAASDGGGGS